MLPKKETLEIEFKSDVKRYPDKDIIEAVSAMANTNGGILYLGVEDNGIVTGLHKSHMDAIGLVALIANNTIPSVSVRAEIVIENQHNVMKISIPMSRAVVSTSSGKILKRRLKNLAIINLMILLILLKKVILLLLLTLLKILRLVS